LQQAIVLNRTQIYASSRRRLALRWHIRLLLRIIPIFLFTYQIISFLQAMRCQTSPNYALYKYDNSTKQLEMDFATNGGMLYSLSSSFLPWQDDGESCKAARMVPFDFEATKAVRLASWRGSLSLLWPMFQTFCLSQFLETLSCALEGRQIQAETGMTLFEHSLAFAEAEAMISAQLGLGPFGGSHDSSSLSNNTYQTSAISAAIAIKRQSVMDHVNTPPEVLLIGLISGLSHLTSNVLSVLGLQARYRLVSTGFFGLCFMSAFLWSFYSFAPGAGGDIGILRFPTVCIIGFIPHLLILVGIAICASIYLLALTISALSPPQDLPPPRGIKDRFRMAHENLQANMQMSNIRINMHEDFYTTLLKLGFMALTAASEAVYLNEGRAIAVRKWTWLEEQRLKEYESNQEGNPSIPSELKDDYGNMVADGVTLADESRTEPDQSSQTRRPQNGGYARERKMQKLQGGKQSKLRVPGDGVGAVERSGRWLLAYEFIRGIFWLICGWMAMGAVKMLEKAGIHWKPRWLRRLLRQKKIPTDARGPSSPVPTENSLEFWLLSDDGILSLPDTQEVDVEAEMRKRMQAMADSWDSEDEAKLESQMYGWFLNNGWWGNTDSSGDFQPNTPDDDTTSMISMSTNATESEWESDPDSSGRRTPTQSNPYPSTRESTPLTDTPLDSTRLAQLLDPRDSADRLEARLLAQHLSSDRILTRARHRRAQDRSRSKIITTNQSIRTRPAATKITLEEEEEILEQLILARRLPEEAGSSSQQAPNASDPSTSSPASTSTVQEHGQGQESGETSWANGAAGLGASGPQCVVCQSSPRTILVWPCRCLSLCEDCRVSLAMNNFGNCVCCRRDVLGFSRIWVP
jgi:endonuclease/exonuclease/phosphatase (EEP) superfamily protein YafD